MSDLLNIVTWNTNFSEKAKDEFESFSFSSRAKFVLDDIKSFLKKSTNTIFCFQEVMPEDMPHFLELFESYEFVIFKKTIHEVGRMLLTCFPQSLKNDLLHIEHWSPSDDASVLTNEERGLSLRDCVDTFFIHTIDLFVCNAHFPMGYKFRLPITKIIANRMKIIDRLNDKPIVIVGDFNTFSDDGGLKQVHIFEEAGFSDLTKVILRGQTTSEKFVPSEPPQRVVETFAAYPYDIIPKKPNMFPYHLDHVFANKVFVENSKEWIVPLCYDNERRLIFKDEKYGVSDHFALSISFNLKQHKQEK